MNFLLLCIWPHLFYIKKVAILYFRSVRFCVNFDLVCWIGKKTIYSQLYSNNWFSITIQKYVYIYFKIYIYMQLYERKNKIQISEIHYWQYFMIMFIFHKFEYRQKNIFIAILCIQYNRFTFITSSTVSI